MKIKIIKIISKIKIIFILCVLININIIFNNNVFAGTYGVNVKLNIDDVFNINNNQSLIVPIKSNSGVHMISFTINNFVGLSSIDLHNKDRYTSNNDIKYEIIKKDNNYKFYIINFSGSSINVGDVVVELILNVGLTNKSDTVKFTNIYVNDEFINEINFAINNPNGIDIQPTNPSPSGGGGGGGGGGGFYSMTNNNLNNSNTKSDVVYSNNFNCRDEFITDIDGHWARDIIVELKNKCIALGFGNDKKNKKFYPDLPIYRGEAIKMIMRAENIDVSKDIVDSGFIDVPKDSIYFKYIAKAKELGIIDGFKDGTFRPKDFITRSQALKIIALTAKISKEKLGNKDYASAYKKYTDVSPLFWDIDYINYFTITNFIQGYADKTFRPNGQITRAEFAKLVYKLLSNKSIK